MQALIITLVGAFFIAATVYLGYVPRIITSWTSTCFISVMWIIPFTSWIIQNCKLRFMPLEVIGKASYHIFLVQMVYYLGYYDKVGQFVSEKLGLGGIVLGESALGKLISGHFGFENMAHLLLGMVICLLIGVLFYYLEKKLTGKLVRKLKAKL